MWCWRWPLTSHGFISILFPQNSGSSATSTPSAPVTGYKRMVIPTQPPLTATKKTTPKPQTGGVSATPPSSASPVAKPQSFTPPQPVPASYATASTPSQPTFNVQVRSAQPGPQHQAPGGPPYGQQPIRSPAQVQYMPAQPRGPDFAYGPPQPGFSPMPHGGYQEHHQPGILQGGGMSARRPEPLPAQQYQPPGPKKTYITDVPPSLAPYNSGPTIPPKVRILLTTQRFKQQQTSVSFSEVVTLSNVKIGNNVHQKTTTNKYVTYFRLMEMILCILACLDYYSWWRMPVFYKWRTR